jgi:hypothetical protein
LHPLIASEELAIKKPTEVWRRQPPPNRFDIFKTKQHSWSSFVVQLYEKFLS